MKRIKKLDEQTINRIAAGEIIHRPANALKELLENSLDAGSSNVQVTVKDGGLKLLQITDNGCGIDRQDLNLLCERFATSKLTKFEDLCGIQTFGFRGEALASISHVAHLSVKTKTQNSNCAWVASYSDGKLLSEPKGSAGNQGTQLTVQDLFYNVIARKKALKNVTEEYNRILTVMQAYAVHHPTCAFQCKKQSASSFDLSTPSNSSVLNNLSFLFGNSIGKNLIHVLENNQKLHFSISAYISNSSYNSKKFQLLLFINSKHVINQFIT